MGFHATSWVLKRSEARGLQRLVLIVLANYANDETGECWPSLATIAEEAKTSQLQAKRVISALVKDGYIKRFVNAAPDSRIPDGRKPNLYRFKGGTPNVPPWLGEGAHGVAKGGPGTSTRGSAQRTPNRSNQKKQPTRDGSAVTNPCPDCRDYIRDFDDNGNLFDVVCHTCRP